MIKAMLTTVDNPHDPFDEFEAWYSWDFNAGYHTPAYLARVTITSDVFPDALQAQHIEQAIDEIIKENGLGLYKKVTKDINDEEYT